MDPSAASLTNAPSLHGVQDHYRIDLRLRALLHHPVYRVLSRIIWVALGGWIVALLYVAASLLLGFTIAFLPFSVQGFRLARFVLCPIGYEAYSPAYDSMVPSGQPPSFAPLTDNVSAISSLSLEAHPPPPATTATFSITPSVAPSNASIARSSESKPSSSPVSDVDPILRDPWHPFTCAANLLWLVFFGWFIASAHLVLSALQFVSVIGIPNGLLHLQLAKLALKCIIVNLDPANDAPPADAEDSPGDEMAVDDENGRTEQSAWTVDVADLITLDDVMAEFTLGPNGGIMYCMEYLLKNWDWLEEQLRPHQDKYVLFDCPGQVELYTHHDGMRDIIKHLSKIGYRLCVTHLVDAHHCTDPGKYIAMVLLSLKTMMQLELPQVNVLSKVDLIESYGRLAFNLDYYTEVQNLSYLLSSATGDGGQSPGAAPLPSAPSVSLFNQQKYRKLNQQLSELVEEYALVQFLPLCLTDAESLQRVLDTVDRANGYMYGGVVVGGEQHEQQVQDRQTEMQRQAMQQRNWEGAVANVQERLLDAHADQDSDDAEMYQKWEHMQAQLLGETDKSLRRMQ
ncbi:hypothetical protein RI367_006153 [Sorochytrium milnesiophthora]